MQAYNPHHDITFPAEPPLSMIRTEKITRTCYHCGEDCDNDQLHVEEKYFCCQGCKTVYQVLNKVELCDYYKINENPGLSQKGQARHDKFIFLDDESLQSKLILYKDASQSHMTLYLPQMHCSSCIWLLEHLNKLSPHIIRSQVNFLKKEINLVFDHTQLSLRQVAEILSSIGYEPHFSLHDISGEKARAYDKSRIYKIGITGFCFGNIMLLSFPEYFSLGNIEEKGLKQLFSILILGLSLPVFFYGASEFFVSAWKSFKQKFLNIDTPIALAVLITFARSVYEIATGTGAGYLDSMTGIVFFMLIGRFFQNKTYNTLAFNRDYTSYFPLGVTIVNGAGEETQIPVSKLRVGHRVKVYSQEIIPADSILFMGKANIDYSFVTGESQPVAKGIGEIIYAGGKQLGGALEMEVVKDVSQSYLTQLWNNEAFRNKKDDEQASYIHVVSRYFTLVLFTIAAAAALYWNIHDPSKVWNAVTAVLIVACPCALLLSATFTNGNMLRVLQKYGFYARNANVIEQIANARHIVFDKTGTLTQQKKSSVNYSGLPLNASVLQMLRSLASQSNHPLSRLIVQTLPSSRALPVKDFREVKGAGIEGLVNNSKVMIGSASFVNIPDEVQNYGGSRVYIKTDNAVLGCFIIKGGYRNGVSEMLLRLKNDYKTSLLSGDNITEAEYLRPQFNSELLFDQLPQDKLNYIKSRQAGNTKVIMVGDGLNDAGALKQSDVGIAVTDNINNFSPSCDVILDGESLPLLDNLLNYCRKNKLIINCSFVISIIYNIVGLYFSVKGDLQPVIAAILMPVSSISIVLLTTGLSSLFSLILIPSRHIKNPRN
jgi:Cu+-exporting ATPase